MIKKFLIIGLFAIVFFGLIPNMGLTFDVNQTGLSATADAADMKTSKPEDLPILVGSIINGVLALIGFVLMIIIIYGGALYMFAGDDKANITKAKAYLTNSIIGVVIIGLAYAISTQVIQLIISAQ